METAKKYSLETYGKPQKALPLTYISLRGVAISSQCYRPALIRTLFKKRGEGMFHNKIPGTNLTVKL